MSEESNDTVKLVENGKDNKDLDIKEKDSHVNTNSTEHKDLTPDDIANQYSEKIRTLKNKQTSSLSAVTKKRNEISKFLTYIENLHLVKSGFEEFNQLCLTYHDSFTDHYDVLSAENEKEHENKRHEEKELSIIGFQTQINGWIAQAERQMEDQFSMRSEKTHSSRRSKGSRSSKGSVSSSKSALVREKAKLAELLAQQSLLKRKQQLREEQEMLDIEINIAKSQAREKVYEEELKSENSAKIDDRKNYSTLQNLGTEKPSLLAKSQVMSKTSGSNELLQVLTQNHNDFMLTTQQKMATAILLPNVEVPKFKGDVLEFESFIRAFDARIVPNASSDSDCLYYLDQQLEGSAKELIGGCMYMDTGGYEAARDLLKKEYGDPYKVSTAYVSKLLAWPAVKSDESLKHFSLFLTKCSYAMKNLSHMEVLHHTPNMQGIVQKLPDYLQNKWRD